MRRRSRNYAKRQVTWFRHQGAYREILWDPLPDFDSAARNVTEFLGAPGV
ncbi:MAG: hypothetical protein LBC78_03775 [Oscillospiraceae bacterium]|nr:hypothetical protein [Oscillospiraceae bacterium]